MSQAGDAPNPFIRLDLEVVARAESAADSDRLWKSRKRGEPIARFRMKRHDIVVREMMRCHPKN